MPLTVSGNKAIVAMLNRALNDANAKEADFATQVAEAGDDLEVLSKTLGDKYSALSDSAFTNLVLGNMGVTAATIGVDAYAALEPAVVDYVKTIGFTNRGLVALQLAQILSGLEADTTYGKAAKAWNTEVQGSFEASDPIGKLTADLTALAAANKAVTDYLKAWGLKQSPADTTPTAAELKAAVETAEAAVSTLLGSADGETLGTKVNNDVLAYNVQNETASNGNSIEDARLAVVKSTVAAKKLALDTALADASKTTAISATLKAAADQLVAAKTSAAAAGVAQDVAAANTTAAVSGLAAASADLSIGNGQGWDANNKTVTIESATLGTIVATYNSGTGVWSYTTAGNASSAPTGIDFTAVFAAAVAELAARQVKTTADANVVLQLDNIAKLDETQFATEKYIVSAVSGGVTYYAKNTSADADLLATAANGGDAANAAAIDAEIAANWTTTVTVANQLVKADAATVDVTNSTKIATTVTYAAGTAAENDLVGNKSVKIYLDAAAAVTAFNKASAKLDAAVAKVDAARIANTELLALEKAAADAKTVALNGTANAIVELSSSLIPVEGSAKADVVLLGAMVDDSVATINNFGTAGKDVIYFGPDYTFNAGKSTTDGNDAVLEFFAKQVGINVVLTFETTKFGSNVVPKVDDAADQVFTITLTGVDLEDLTIADGFIGFGG